LLTPTRPQPFSPAQLLAVSFLALIAAGTLLLTLPLASQGERLSIIDAFFTATSAVCVTGLIVVDTPNALSLFGQVVVLLLVQVGGLGYMAITTVVGVALGRQLSMQERLTLSEAFNVQTMDGLVRFVFTVLKLTLAFEAAGALILAVHWADDFGPGRAAWYGVFHAVSAFNNAGFSLFADNMIGFRGDWVVNLVITSLVIAGGLGFVVLTEIGRRRSVRRFSTHTRLVLNVTAGLLAGTTVLVALIEWHNPRTLGPLGGGEAVLAAWFQAVVPRTAGFNSVDISALAPATLFLMMVLMFIGAAPGGTAGGVKITTFSITAASLWAMVRGDEEATLLRRRLAPSTVARAFSICLLAFLGVNVVAGMLLITEGRELLPTLFEATSAFGTVGLSMSENGEVVSLSSHFTALGKTLVALLMFVGRVGPLTLAVAVAQRRSKAAIRYPEGKILIG
jgi:trk system potassium uptake protein TrkH